MTIRAGLATVAGECRVPYRHSGTFDRPYVSFVPSIPEILQGIEYFIASEQERIADLKASRREETLKRQH